MNRLEFDDKLFQRGRTWDECLESWSFKRRDFLKRVSQATPLVATRETLQKLPSSTRIALYFSMNHLDSCLAIPLLGVTLEVSPHLEARFFGTEYFFPLLNPHFGRATPRLALLDEQGGIRSLWGPRPDSVEHLLKEAEIGTGSKVDQWLLNLDPAQYQSDLDQSIHSFLKDQLS